MPLRRFGRPNKNQKPEVGNQNLTREIVKAGREGERERVRERREIK